jgi:uncharacterized protein (UPF0261 family)
MRTTADENRALGRHMVQILGSARAPLVLMIPRGGVSALDAPGQPFHDRRADEALFDVLRTGLAGHRHVQLVEREEHINDPGFGDAAAVLLLELLERTEGNHVPTNAQ